MALSGFRMAACLLLSTSYITATELCDQLSPPSWHWIHKTDFKDMDALIYYGQQTWLLCNDPSIVRLFRQDGLQTVIACKMTRGV